MSGGQCESIKEGVVKLSVSGSGQASDLTEAETSCGRVAHRQPGWGQCDF